MSILSTPTYSWYYDSSGTDSLPAGRSDFYQVVLHELGHAHALKHINDKNELMFWHAVQSASITPVADRNHYIDGGTFEGGLDVVDSSINNSFNSCSPGSELIKFSGGGCIAGTGIFYPKKQNDDILHIYPNPSGSKVNVTLKRNDVNSNHVMLRLYCSSGSVVKELRFQGKQRLIDLSGLPDGLYVLRINLKDKVLTEKVIKQ